MRSRLAFVTAFAVVSMMHAEAKALSVPYVEDFTTSASGWTDSASSPLAWQASGGPDDGSYASESQSWFGFASPFPGVGPVTFRGNGTASGGAFAGDWLAASVDTISVWIYNGTPAALTPFLRVATSANFPGAVFFQTESVAADSWGQVSFDIDPSSPLCTQEIPTWTCAQALQNVGIIQFGTDAPDSLVETNQSYTLGIDKVSINAVPEPASAALLSAALAGLALRRRRG